MEKAVEKDRFSISDALKCIYEGLVNIKSDLEWQNFLVFQAKFHSYSFGNTMLIYFQKPNASYVLGFSKWKTLGRYVRKGEQSIKILAPVTYKDKESEEEKDRYILAGFKPVSVFDISQTEGDTSSLPILVKGLPENNQYSIIYESIKAAIGIPVVEKSDMRSKGHYNLNLKQITINNSYSDTQMLKTLLHEYAHHLHFTQYFQDEASNVCEIIAESAAYVVSKYLNIDTSDYSFGYIMGWSDNLNEFNLVCNKIQKISDEIIKKIEPHNSSRANGEALNMYKGEEK